jgi:D-xylose transport system ATP-binding protein
VIKRLRDQGHGVVVISHNLADVFAVADRIVVLRLGKQAGEFEADAVSQERVVAAMTGADVADRENGDDQGGKR